MGYGHEKRVRVSAASSSLVPSPAPAHRPLAQTTQAPAPAHMRKPPSSRAAAPLQGVARRGGGAGEAGRAEWGGGGGSLKATHVASAARLQPAGPHSLAAPGPCLRLARPAGLH